MPALAQLRRLGYAVWPFDHWAGAGAAGGSGAAGPAGRCGPAVVEVWPRLAAPTVVKSRPEARRAWCIAHSALLGPGVADLAGASDDAFDAVAAVVALASLGRSALAPVRDRTVWREGWIAGVPLPPDNDPGHP